MTLYIYLQVKPIQQISFSSPLSEWLTTYDPTIVMAEVDNHSEAFLVSKCVPLIEKADQIILHMEAHEEEILGALKSIFERFRKLKKPILSITQGDHQGLVSMLKLMKIDSNNVSDLAKAKSLISDFFNLEINSKN